MTEDRRKQKNSMLFYFGYIKHSSYCMNFVSELLNMLILYEMQLTIYFKQIWLEFLMIQLDTKIYWMMLLLIYLIHSNLWEMSVQ